MAQPRSLSPEAQVLIGARDERRSVSQLSDSYDLTLERAYGVQREQREGRGPLVGWKLGVTSRAKQAQVGVDSPIYGFLGADHVLDVGEPLDTSQHIAPRCEPEIVFVMGRPLSGSAVTATEVLAATAGVAVGIEVLDSRYTDYQFTMPDVVADNASAGRYVVGTPVPPAGIDLRLVGVVTRRTARSSPPPPALRRSAIPRPRSRGWCGLSLPRTRGCARVT